MSVFKMAPDLFLIERGYLSGNRFVSRSEKPVLIDTGCVDGTGETERLFRFLGVDLSTFDLMTNTHSHCDHVGGNRVIQEK